MSPAVRASDFVRASVLIVNPAVAKFGFLMRQRAQRRSRRRRASWAPRNPVDL